MVFFSRRRAAGLWRLPLVALVIALAACGGSGTSSPPSGSTPSSSMPSSSTPASSAASSLVPQSSSSDVSLFSSSASSHTLASSAQARFQLSGYVHWPQALVVDSDVNDMAAPYRDNSTPEQAQRLHSQAQVQGYVSAQPSGGDPARERFAEQADSDDFFRVALAAGQRITLQPFAVAGGDEADDGDVDLYLFDSQLQLLAVSEGSGNREILVVAEDGDYLINVHAAAGASRYLLHLLPAEPAAGAAALPQFVPGEMLVKYRQRAGTGPKAQHMVRERLPLSQPGSRALAQVRASNPQSYERLATLQAIKQTRLQAGVEYAEPNYLRRPQLLPNDPGYSYQWGHGQVQLPEAWDITTGHAAEPVIVAVVDTGVVFGHPDLADSFVAGYDFVSDPQRARDGDGIDADPSDPGDSDQRGASSWHGTHVSGIIAATTDNKQGMAGVSWGAKVMPIRALGVDGGTSYDIVQGLRYAAGLSNDSGTLPARPARIINLSFAGPDASQLARDTYAELRAAGVILVAAAGNSGRDIPLYPAAYPGVIAVGATDYRRLPAYYSTYGTHLSLAAPGGDLTAEYNPNGLRDGIYSTSADDLSGAIRPIYRLRQGTSAAAPYVSGIIALMLSLYPQLTPDQLERLIRAGLLSDAPEGSSWSPYLGWGHINARKAVEVARDLAAGIPVEPVQQPVNLQLSPARLQLGFADTGYFSLTNQGGGSARLLSLNSDAAWLQVHAEDVDAQGLGRYRVSALRQGLASGLHQGSLRLVLAGQGEETRILPIRFLVDAPVAGGTSAPVYVSLVDAATGELHASQRAQPSDSHGGSLSFEFSDLLQGSYFIFAGSDTDANQKLCEPGESCAVLGAFAQPQTIILNDDSPRSVSLLLQLELLVESLIENNLSH